MTFTVDLTKYAKKTKSEIGTAKRAIVFNIFKQVIQKTPVATGRAKGNWFITENAPSTQVSQTTDMTNKGGIGPEAQKQLNNITLNLGLDFLTNNLPYIGRLEFGSSSQAPSGMVRTTLRQFTSIAKKEGWS